MAGTHALLSPSASARWLNCPPSARLSAKLASRFGDQASSYALEGTKAHTLGELKLRREIEEINEFNYQTMRKTLGDIPKKMDWATDVYVDTVMEKFFSARKSCPDAQLLLEQRLDFSEWVPSGSGTGDTVIVSDQILEVIDYKNGSGVPVSAVDNPQARLYGLGAYARFGDLFGFPIIRNTIVQPNLDSITEETLTREELLAWAEEIKPIAALAWEGKGEFKTGDHCRFCHAKAICGARAAEAMELFKHGFDAPGVLPDEAIPGILKVADTTEAWIKDIRAYALNQALRGKDWAGYKLVSGKRPNRSWRDEEAVKEQLIRAGYDEETYISTKLKGVSELEKALGKAAFTAFLGSYVSQGDGALTLVPEEDKRIAFSSAENDFSDLVQN